MARAAWCAFCACEEVRGALGVSLFKGGRLRGLREGRYAVCVEVLWL